jgi:hypothetical protein
MIDKLLKLARPYFITIVLCAVGLSACSDDGGDDEKTNLRFINTISGLASVDLLIDFDLYFDNVGYFENSSYFEINTDPHIFQVTPSNSLSPIDETKAALDDGTDYTYLAYGSSLSAGAMLLRDDNDPPGDNTFKVRVIDVAQSTRSLDLYIVTDPRSITSVSPTAANMRYKTVTQYSSGRSGTYSVIVTDSKSGRVLGRAAPQSFDEKQVYTIVVANPEQGPSSTAVNVVVISADSGKN